MGAFPSLLVAKVFRHRVTSVPVFFCALAASITVSASQANGASGRASSRVFGREAPLSRHYMARLHSEKTFVVFDWDDNVLKMPTRLILFPKGGTRTNPDENIFYISSPELANFKGEVGKPGTPLEKFEVITDAMDPINGSFRFTMPGSLGRNYMLEDMKRIVTENDQRLDHIPDDLKAPFYELFMRRETRAETRRANRILTGRGQTRDEFHEAVSFLATVPEIAMTGFEPPARESLTLVGGRGNAWEQKAHDLIVRMNEAASKGYTLFAFPDDDPMNIRRAAEVLAEIERPIDVWLIWTREHGDSRVLDLSKLDAAKGVTIDVLIERAFDLNLSKRDLAIEHSQHETERRRLMCRALFF